MYTPSLDTRLEVPREQFFAHKNVHEEIVLERVEELRGFMVGLDRGPFLIAGAGSVLRNIGHGCISDVDIVVAGLNYTPMPARHGGHTPEDLADFEKVVRMYYQMVLSGLEDVQKADLRFYSRGSYLLGRCDEVMIGRSNGEKVDVGLNGMNDFLSMGVTIRTKKTDIYPLDIQFAFNSTPAMWKEDQSHIYDKPSSYKNPRMLYAILYESS